MTNNILPISEFRASGYLQEVNRLFFHPIGLALSIKTLEDGTEVLGDIWDCRDDPEGIAYGDVSKCIDVEAARRVFEEFLEKAQARYSAYGWVIQPIE